MRDLHGVGMNARTALNNVRWFRRTGVFCVKCRHECLGHDGFGGVYCTHESCPAWWTQGKAPGLGQRIPNNEVAA